MTNDCHFSRDRQYRYSLLHDWRDLVTQDRLQTCCWIGLNPSTADEEALDPTLRRIRDFSQRWGFSRFVMLNLFAFRATDPARMMTAKDPVGPENDETLVRHCRDAGMIVACWGAYGRHRNRDMRVLDILHDRKLHCLGRNRDGSPRHPLYLPAGQLPELL